MARPRVLSGAQKGNLTVVQQDKLKAEEEVLYNYDKLDFSYYPNELLPQAYNEWDRIAAYVGDLPISELDVNTVTRYCNYTYLYAEATKHVATYGVLTEEGKKSPYLDAMNSYSKELKACASDLGLNIPSRLKMSAPAIKDKEDSDPFAKMLKNKA